MKILKWDRRKCPRCRRQRVHFMPAKRQQWVCIGRLPGKTPGLADCGDPVVR